MSISDIRYQYMGWRHHFLTLPNILTFVASICSIFSLWISIINGNYYLSILPLVFLIFVLFIHVLCIEFSYASSKRHAEGSPLIHQIFHIIRDLHYDVTTGNMANEKIISVIENICNRTRDYFNIATGTKCRISIKFLECDTENFNSLKLEEQKRRWFVVTPFRDDATHESEKLSETKHELCDNTAFKEVFTNNPVNYKYFFSNDLISLYHNGRYENTSFGHYGKPNIKKFFIALGRGWTLPYRSAIVLPIRKIKEGDSSKKEKITFPFQDLIGFLTIDTNTRGAFNKYYDTEIAGAIADGLYIVFSHLKNEKSD